MYVRSLRDRGYPTPYALRDELRLLPDLLTGDAVTQKQIGGR
jgi:hypothetical protein